MPADLWPPRKAQRSLQECGGRDDGKSESSCSDDESYESYDEVTVSDDESFISFYSDDRLSIVMEETPDDLWNEVSKRSRRSHRVGGTTRSQRRTLDEAGKSLRPQRTAEDITTSRSSRSMDGSALRKILVKQQRTKEETSLSAPSSSESPATQPPSFFSITPNSHSASTIDSDLIMERGLPSQIVLSPLDSEGVDLNEPIETSVRGDFSRPPLSPTRMIQGYTFSNQKESTTAATECEATTASCATGENSVRSWGSDLDEGLRLSSLDNSRREGRITLPAGDDRSRQGAKTFIADSDMQVKDHDRNLSGHAQQQENHSAESHSTRRISGLSVMSGDQDSMLITIPEDEWLNLFEFESVQNKLAAQLSLLTLANEEKLPRNSENRQHHLLAMRHRLKLERYSGLRRRKSFERSKKILVKNLEKRTKKLDHSNHDDDKDSSSTSSHGNGHEERIARFGGLARRESFRVAKCDFERKFESKVKPIVSSSPRRQSSLSHLGSRTNSHEVDFHACMSKSDGALVVNMNWNRSEQETEDNPFGTGSEKMTPVPKIEQVFRRRQERFGGLQRRNSFNRNRRLFNKRFDRIQSKSKEEIERFGSIERMESYKQSRNLLEPRAESASIDCIQDTKQHFFVS